MSVRGSPAVKDEVEAPLVFIEKLLHLLTSHLEGLVDVAAESSTRWGLSLGVKVGDDVDEPVIVDSGIGAVALCNPFKEFETIGAFAEATRQLVRKLGLNGLLVLGSMLEVAFPDVLQDIRANTAVPCAWDFGAMTEIEINTTPQKARNTY